MGLGELAEAGFQETNEQLKTLKARIDALETSGPFGFRMPSPACRGVVQARVCFTPTAHRSR